MLDAPAMHGTHVRPTVPARPDARAPCTRAAGLRAGRLPAAAPGRCDAGAAGRAGRRAAAAPDDAGRLHDLGGAEPLLFARLIWEERRVGEGCVGTCRSGWSTSH